ncbi:MAG: hypothetical protein OJF55_002149 [Rhodanobacteraceae bacterium]|nr:MAG: hypothetical protein OJF55_002149 [Rhodanobacteraceae bacterium]
MVAASITCSHARPETSGAEYLHAGVITGDMEPKLNGIRCGCQQESAPPCHPRHTTR